MGVLDGLKDLFYGYPDDLEDEDYIDDSIDVNDGEEDQGPVTPKFMNSSKKVVNINSKDRGLDSNAKVVIYNPVRFEEATSIVDSLLTGKIAIIELKNMKETNEPGRVQNKSQARKEIFDYLNGAIYAINGTSMKLSSTIFVLAPPNVDIDTNLQSDSYREDYSGLWASKSVL